MYIWIPLDSSADLSKLVDHISSEYNPKKVTRRLEEGITDAVKAVLIEYNYIDKDYRSTYYHFYAKKGQRYKLDCVRLHFFDETVSFNEDNFQLNCNDDQLGHHYFGYMVLRPTGISTIGRTVLSASVRNGASGSIITALHKVHLLGYELTYQGFPSMDQHTDISVCAHVACWAILRHYSECFNVHREYSIYDITLMTQQFNPGGLIPSKGLDVSHAERVFQTAGTYPVHIAREGIAHDGNPVDDPSFFRQLIAYVESGFPLFAATYDHAIAIIGYKWKAPGIKKPDLEYAWDRVESLIVVDDNHLPYLSIPVDGDDPYDSDDIESFVVSLPEKIFYPADAVDRFAPILRSIKIVELPPEDETIIRYFITTGSAFRKFVRKHASEFDPVLLKQVMVLPFAQFLWVVEFSTKSEWEAGQISARAVLDATASLRDLMPIWLFHNRDQALVFDRRTVGIGENGLTAFGLTGMKNTTLKRMSNLDPIQPK